MAKKGPDKDFLVIWYFASQDIISTKTILSAYLSEFMAIILFKYVGVNLSHCMRVKRSQNQSTRISQWTSSFLRFKCIGQYNVIAILCVVLYFSCVQFYYIHIESKRNIILHIRRSHIECFIYSKSPYTAFALELCPINSNLSFVHKFI